MAGLAAAHRLTELAPHIEVVVLEARDRVGGVVATERTDGFVIERGPDSILTEKPWAVELAKRLGLAGELVGTLPGRGGSFVVARGKLERIPDGFALLAPTDLSALVFSPILSWRGKARAALDLALPRGAEGDDESLGSFVRRRFGKEVLDRLAEPLAGGIYGADPDRMSLRATLPRFLDAERRDRSVILGMRRTRRSVEGPSGGARYGLFVSFATGMQTLPDALEKVLGRRIHCGAECVALERVGERRWKIRLADSSVLEGNAVVLATPVDQAARLVGPFAPDLALLLGTIGLGSSVAVTLAWPRMAIDHPLDGYGFVVPRAEGRPLQAVTWASEKYPGRAPESVVLMRGFIGGVGRADFSRHADHELVSIARTELRDLVGVRLEPVLERVDRYVRAMPRYEVGHLDLVDRIDRHVDALPSLGLAGNAYRGVGLPDTVHSGERAAERVLAAMSEE